MATSLRQVFHDIAESIRAKGVSGQTMKPIEMASKIGEIQTGGGSDYGYLTFTAVEDTELTLKQNGGISPHKLLKSSDGIHWTKWENPDTHGILLVAGESVYIKADEDASNRTATSDTAFNSISSTGKVGCMGDIRSIINMDPASYDNWMHKLFNNSSITTAPELPATTLANGCYQNMFQGCTSLTSPPELPATTLANGCYQNMFQGCTSLTSAPELPATTLNDNCYESMFAGCGSLVEAPVLDSTNLTFGCYSHMFEGCTSLASAPLLPATTLDRWCYSHMFKGCTSLASAPLLPATTLDRWCYGYMFEGCTSLLEAPYLPAINLVDNCYESMFYNCTSLVEAPVLDSTNLTFGCYSHMFEGCTSLKRVESDIPGSEQPDWIPDPDITLPEWVLPATSLSDWCYNCMFKGCTSLEVAPTIMANTTGGDYWECFNGMFQGCTNLRRVKINLAEGVLSSGMFDGCTSLYLVDMTGATGIPRLSGTPVFPADDVDFTIVVPDELFDEWYMNESWLSVQNHIRSRTEWNEMHPDDQL